MSNKEWDLISYAQSASVSNNEKHRRAELADKAWDLAWDLAKDYMKRECSGYPAHCAGTNCFVVECPNHTHLPNHNP